MMPQMPQGMGGMGMAPPPAGPPMMGGPMQPMQMGGPMPQQPRQRLDPNMMPSAVSFWAYSSKLSKKRKIPYESVEYIFNVILNLKAKTICEPVEFVCV